MKTPYVRIVMSEWGYNYERLEFSNGETSWSKNLVELTSYIGVYNTEEEKIKFKQSYCDYISYCIGINFTVEEFDKIVTKKHYQLGMYAYNEFKYMVETNIKCVEQGKEPKYHGISIIGDMIIKSLMKEIQKDLTDA